MGNPIGYRGQYSGDLNDFMYTGFYYTSGDISNAPTTNGFVIAMKAAWQVFQLFISSTGKVYVRTYWSSSAGWTSWSELN